MDDKEKDLSVITEFPYYLNKNNTISIWDDPSIQGGTSFPENYYPLTNLMSVMSRLTNGYLDEIDITLLKVLGDAICANEDQLKRYMQSHVTRTQVSNKLRRLRENGFVERWQVESDLFPTELKPPAPFTLGMAGFSIMKQLYFSNFFMNPQKWQVNGLPNIQRHVAANELRCQLVERKVLRNWKWNSVILNNPLYQRPFAVAEVETPKGNLNFVIERVQQGKDFVGYLSKKLNEWAELNETHSPLTFKNVNKNPCIFVIYASSISIANKLAFELFLEKKPLPVWLCIEEELDKGIENSFFKPLEDGKLGRLQLDFLSAPFE